MIDQEARDALGAAAAWGQRYGARDVAVQVPVASLRALLDAFDRKRPEPEITDEMVERAAAGMHREHVQRYPDEPGASFRTAGPLQPVWRHLARAALEAAGTRVPAAKDARITVRHVGGNTLAGTVEQVLSTHLAKGWTLE